jgi:hypothetical protein
MFRPWQPWCHLLAVCLSNVGALTSRNPMGLHGLWQGYIYLYLIPSHVCSNSISRLSYLSLFMLTDLFLPNTYETLKDKGRKWDPIYHRKLNRATRLPWVLAKEVPYGRRVSIRLYEWLMQEFVVTLHLNWTQFWRPCTCTL